MTMSTPKESTPGLQGYVSDTVLVIPIWVFRKADILGTAGIGMRCKPWDARVSQVIPQPASHCCGDGVKGQQAGDVRGPLAIRTLRERVPN